MMGEMSHWHEVVLFELLFCCIDLLQLLQVICIVALIIQAPSLFRRLCRLALRHNKETGFSTALRRQGQSYLAKVVPKRRQEPDGTSPTYGLELPDEVVVRIFSNLNFKELALGAGLVCRCLRKTLCLQFPFTSHFFYDLQPMVVFGRG